MKGRCGRVISAEIAGHLQLANVRTTQHSGFVWSLPCLFQWIWSNFLLFGLFNFMSRHLKPIYLKPSWAIIPCSLLQYLVSVIVKNDHPSAVDEAAGDDHLLVCSVNALRLSSETSLCVISINAVSWGEGQQNNGLLPLTYPKWWGSFGAPLNWAQRPSLPPCTEGLAMDCILFIITYIPICCNLSKLYANFFVN